MDGGYNPVLSYEGKEQIDGESTEYFVNLDGRKKLSSSLNAMDIATHTIPKFDSGNTTLFRGLIEKYPILVTTHIDTTSKGRRDLEIPKKSGTYVEGEVIKVEEDNEHEFKAVQESTSPASRVIEYCRKYINAFLNSNGGTIYFGVTDDGIIAGIILTQKNRDDIKQSVDEILQQYLPKVNTNLVKIKFIPVEPKSTHIDISLKYVIEVRVQIGEAPVYTLPDGRAYIRRTGSVHRMDPSLIEIRKVRGRPIFNGILPDIPKDFIGRETEMEIIQKYIQQSVEKRIIILNGSPIVGKSTVSRQIVKLYSSLYCDRQLIINLKGVSNSYISAVEGQVNLIRSVYPILVLPNDKNKVKDIYNSCFENKSCILLLENIGSLNHVMDLMPSGFKQLLIIATSRRDFPIPENLDILSFKLLALTPESASKLFKSIINNNNIVDDDIDKITKYCGYMPLPIKLMALKLKSLKSPLDITGLLESDSDSIMETTTKIFDASFSPKQSRYSLILSLFPSSFDDYAASDILMEDEERTRRILHHLVDENELEFASEIRRYSLNDLYRSYCLKRREVDIEKSELNGYKRRFIEYFLRTLKVFMILCNQRSILKGLDMFMIDKDNFEAMISYSLDLEDWDMCALVYASIDSMNRLFGKGEQKKWDQLLDPLRASREIMKRVAVYTSTRIDNLCK